MTSARKAYPALRSRPRRSSAKETVDEGKEDLQDTQEEAKAKFGEAQGKLSGRPLSAAAVAAVAVALLLLLLLRRRRGSRARSLSLPAGLAANGWRTDRFGRHLLLPLL
jgi:ElaB/YqjD/DUF883 family membrane-anchored ribosome-binding protein